ncbi:hypothetical protein BC829DRAFT_491185 [Chytridium lagenaria]|nr:hypothetical protein BC829DRAFT_491185 [Chytridium lagenaria]
MITFMVYTILAFVSEFMYISMIWELAKMRECKQFVWVCNVCEFFLYLSILSFAMGNVSRLLQYLVLLNPSIPNIDLYRQVISLFGADIAEAPFMMAVMFSLVILTDNLKNANISFLKAGMSSSTGSQENSGVQGTQSTLGRKASTAQKLGQQNAKRTMEMETESAVVNVE